MPQPIKLGQNARMSFHRFDEKITKPNLIAIQRESYEWFVEEGIKEAFEDVSPIKDYTENLILEFVDYEMSDDPKYPVEECKARDATYAVTLTAKVRFINKTTGEIKEQKVFMGEFPKMTSKGTFVINGSERVIVSQLIRSPGTYYEVNYNKAGKEMYSGNIIPNRGTWLEYETNAAGVLSVRINRSRKIPITVFMRALGLSSDQEIINFFGEDERLLKTLDKDSTSNQEEGLLEIYKKLRPGEPPTVESAQSLLDSMFFNEKRYDLARVGRFKVNSKVAFKRRVNGQTLAADVVNENTGEILFEEGHQMTKEDGMILEKAGIQSVRVKLPDDQETVIVSNRFVDLNDFVDVSKLDVKIKEKVHYPVLMEILENNETEEDILFAIKTKKRELSPKKILIDDVFATMSYIINLFYGIGEFDDIDHLGNRRIRSVGELLQNQFRIGLSRMRRVVRERMTTKDMESVTPQNLINVKPVIAAMKEFFGSSQLSQFMDQTNPLSEITHRRRLSALGPGGLSRERAGFKVRDVHHSHYGRMCPIETPEGPNIGLIVSLSSYGEINEYGFIETPYRVVDKENARVTDEIIKITADIEEGCVSIPATEAIDEDGYIINDRVVGRKRSEIKEFSKYDVDFMEISPQQMVSVATAMIPFLENDDANRALMGANMQRQAVPLLWRESPIIGTGMEYKAGKDCGSCILADSKGIVEYVSADKVVIKRDADGGRDVYNTLKFKRSNQGTTVNSYPVVHKNMKVKPGDVLVDSTTTDHGEMSLGKNILIGFMTWEGYNYEDAILLSEELVKKDTLTSVHIEEYEIEARDTKLGSEEVTREIPNVSNDALKELDERGIIRIGAEVQSGDILVGKVTPKGETELTAEERLLRAIFGEKAREVRDNSLKVPHGSSGIVIDVKVFDRKNGDELKPGVNSLIRVYVAKKRKIKVGDKLAGRHGNKGVISRILPEEDMPFLDDGTPLQILLNPLGVPSRMNIGQVLEVHLGLAAKKLDWKIATPVFDGAREDQIMDLLEKAGYPRDGKLILRDGRTGEKFDNPVTVGYMYILKLYHLVDSKLHARSTGPYSLVTQQPLGGKAQFGGQRFGEMEVWALEAYGAAHTLQEMLTVKSDDVVGRVKTYEAIIKGENIPKPGMPESFKVLIKELQALALDVKLLSTEETAKEIEIEES